MFDHLRPSKKSNVLFLVQNLHFCMRKSKKRKNVKDFQDVPQNISPKFTQNFFYGIE